MNLSRLLNPGRYRRCRTLFRSPLRTHIQLAILRRQPITLTLRDGRKLTIRKPRSFRHILNGWIDEEQPPSLDVTPEGAVSFDYDGFHLTLRPDSGDAYVFREVFIDDVYQLNALLGPLDTVVDLGANIGLFSLRAARQARRVVAVESCAANCDLARRNLARNGLEDRITLVEAAATGESQAHVRLHLSQHAGGHSLQRHLAVRWPNDAVSLVRAISLADLFDEYRIQRCSLLKCDIEGSEYAVIERAPLEILQRVERFLIEAHPGRDDRPWHGLHNLCGKLRAAGMRLRLEFTSSQTVMIEATSTRQPALLRVAA